MKWKLPSDCVRQGNDVPNLPELSLEDFKRIEPNLMSRDEAFKVCPIYVKWIEGSESEGITVYAQFEIAHRGQDMVTAVEFGGKTLYVWATVGSIAWTDRVSGIAMFLPSVTAVLCRRKSVKEPRIFYPCNGYYMAPKGWVLASGTRASFQALDHLMDTMPV